MRPYLLFICACACALAGALAASADDGSPPPGSPDIAVATTTDGPEEPPDLAARELRRRIDDLRRRAWRWQRVIGGPLTRRLPNPPRSLQAEVPAWRQVAQTAQVRALHPPHARAWSCIHRYEGAWHDTGSPYYGGLQMDIGFQRTYGNGLLARKGTADRWTPLEQMWTAERAYRAGRGFYPWPNTARYCGLL